MIAVEIVLNRDTLFQAHTAVFGSVGLFLFCSKTIAAANENAGNRYLKDTISFGVQPMILHSFSKVSMVMFPFFLRESSV